MSLDEKLKFLELDNLDKYIRKQKEFNIGDPIKVREDLEAHLKDERDKSHKGVSISLRLQYAGQTGRISEIIKSKMLENSPKRECEIYYRITVDYSTLIWEECCLEYL